MMSGVLIALMLIYPPFEFMGHSLGYGWIFSPPGNHYAMINNAQLLVQWIAVVLIGGILFLLSHDSTSSNSLVRTKSKSPTLILEAVLKTTLLFFRIIRGIALFSALAMSSVMIPILFLWVLHLFDRISNPDALSGIIEITDAALPVFSIGLIGYVLFFGLSYVINKIHSWRYGVPHPALWVWWSL